MPDRAGNSRKVASNLRISIEPMLGVFLFPCGGPGLIWNLVALDHAAYMGSGPPLGDPMQIEVRGGQWSIRRVEAAQIAIEDLKPQISLEVIEGIAGVSGSSPGAAPRRTCDGEH